jgi:hypothetical protein
MLFGKLLTNIFSVQIQTKKELKTSELTDDLFKKDKELQS